VAPSPAPFMCAPPPSAISLFFFNSTHFYRKDPRLPPPLPFPSCTPGGNFPLPIMTICRTPSLHHSSPGESGVSSNTVVPALLSHPPTHITQRLLCLGPSPSSRFCFVVYLSAFCVVPSSQSRQSFTTIALPRLLRFMPVRLVFSSHDKSSSSVRLSPLSYTSCLSSHARS